MKNNKIIKVINKYLSGTSVYEYYKNTQGQFHGYYIHFYSHGQKYSEGSCNFGRNVGVWKYWKDDGRRHAISTWKEDGLNGVSISFFYCNVNHMVDHLASSATKK